MLKKHQFISLSLLSLVASTAQSTSTSYFSQVDFLNALGSASVTTYNFDSMSAGDVIANGTTIDGATFSYNPFGGGPYSIVVDNFYDTTSPTNYLGSDDGSGAFYGGDSLTISFDESIRAFGMYVISADIIFPDDFTIETNSGHSVSNLNVDITLLDGDAYYISFIEDDASLAFNQIVFSSFADDYLFNIDDITVSAIPVPAAVWLFASGLVGLIGVSRCKK